MTLLICTCDSYGLIDRGDIGKNPARCKKIRAIADFPPASTERFGTLLGIVRERAWPAVSFALARQLAVTDFSIG